MYIRSIKFRDWKAYANAEFRFPEPNSQKNVVLIGAKNGYGKTSLLEGIILGLYGKDGMDILARAFENTPKSYDEFLEKALHAQALEQGRTSISIEIVLEEGFERVRINRKWHFNGRGEHKKDDEQTILFEGPSERDSVVKPSMPNPTREEASKFYKDYIGTKFIPMHLAEFFLFDGERVQQLARKDKADVVKMGIEGILGVQTLRTLQNDLEDYVINCRSKTQKIDDSKLEENIRNLDLLTNETANLESKKELLSEDDHELSKLIAEKRKILLSMSGSGMQNIKELNEDKVRIEKRRSLIEARLGDIIKTKLALALAGKNLRFFTEKTLKAENRLVEWQYSKNHTQDKLESLLKLFDKTEDILPPLSESQISSLKEKLSAAWSNLWYPPPTDCASRITHFYLTEKERVFVIDKLEEIEKVGIKDINQLLVEHQDSSKEINKIDSRIVELTGVDDRLRVLIEEQKDLDSKHRKVLTELEACKRSIDANNASIKDLKSNINLMQSRQDSSQPNIKRANIATKVKELISEAIGDLYPKYVGKLSIEMTNIYKQLAHKTVVKKIEIDSDCVVRLLGNKGKDLRASMDSSAGEDQVFSLALIAAIAKVSGAKIPIVMDTPLARLDSDHRSNVLKYFSTCPSEQIIFLSQPEEIDERYYKSIKDRVGKTYHITFEELHDGVGVAEINDGYF